MSEIKCPKVRKYLKRMRQDLLIFIKQVRDREFEKDLRIMKDGFEKESESAVQLAKAAVRDELKRPACKKRIDLNRTKIKW